MWSITERIVKSLLGEQAMHKLPAISKQPIEENVPGNERLPLPKKNYQKTTQQKNS